MAGGFALLSDGRGFDSYLRFILMLYICKYVCNLLVEMTKITMLKKLQNSSNPFDNMCEEEGLYKENQVPQMLLINICNPSVFPAKAALSSCKSK